MAEMRLITELGAEVLVPVTGETASDIRESVLRTLREYGRLGWHAGGVPAGGFRFPLANEQDFDWRLLGARRGKCTVEAAEREGVWHGGHFYTRRELEPNPRKKMGPAVKYSRGARHTDPPHLVEEGDGDFRYVTLAVFRGEGQKREEYAIPQAPEPAPQGAPSAEPPSTTQSRARPRSRAAS